ncbi:MAG: sigma-70 family RNA polymerase sigma factor [Kiritimatiellae bacterium]|nr:sigma-70 family RNA polymerase sigma factor [Kiritimatiellia bacterium]
MRSEGDRQAIDSKAFEILVRQYHRRMLAYALSLVGQAATAEDIVQEAFVTAYRKLDQFDASRDFGHWVRGIVRMKYLEWTRRRREYPLDEGTLEGLDREHAKWDRAAEDGREDVLAALRKCLAGLREVARHTVELFYLRSMTCAAIAAELGATEVGVKKRLQRGREALAACMDRRLRMIRNPGY